MRAPGTVRWGSAMIRGALLVLGFGGGCVRSCNSRPDPVDEGAVVRLQALPFAELTVPPHSRDSETIPDKIPLSGPWRREGVSTPASYSTALPIRPRGLFFNKPEPDISLLSSDGATIPYDRGPLRSGTEWRHDRDRLVVITEDGNAPDGFTLVYPRANAREAALNRALSGAETDAAFVWTTIQDDWDARQGLLLPAPGVAAWDVTVPPAAELSFTPGIVLPEVRASAGSDGGRVAVEVEEGGKASTVWSGQVLPAAFSDVRVDLSAWAGKAVRLRFRTEPAGTSLFDYVFIAEPALASRKKDPVRVVMVFVDTLRPDHMSLYDYERDTTAAIDHLRGEAAVFTAAHSVAPWTLPAARAIVTGRQPEHYDSSATLQGILGEQGFASAFFAGNMYLSVNFGMNRDWDLHRVGGLFPSAQQPTDDAIAWLEAHEGRDAVIQVHYMDAHLPYHEPSAYRNRYAGAAHPALGEEFHLPNVRQAKIDGDLGGQDYIRARYDNNIRYATDQIARLLSVLDDNDIVLLYADHGEEFWEHGGYEHGHTVFEELLHVPLVIKAPGVKPQGISVPVSLLDLTPTILDLVGAPIPNDMDGASLAPLLRGEDGAEAPLAARDLAFGRPLYGVERWGVLHGTEKWSVFEGREALYELATDPEELLNQLIDDPDDRAAVFRDYLAEAIGQDVVVGYRLTPTQYKGRPTKGLWALCTVPGGFSRAWGGADPLTNGPATVRTLTDHAEIEALLAARAVPSHPVGKDDGAVEICWHPGYVGSREVYVVPERPLAEVGKLMACSGFLGGAEGGKRGTMRIHEGRSPTLGQWRTPLNRLLWDERHLLWQFGIAPAPFGSESSARDGETDSMLQALGYQLPDDQDVPEGEAVGTLRPCEPPTSAPLAP